MIGPQASAGLACRCGALRQHSWWDEILEDSDYRVVRVDTLNSLADVLTIEVSSEPESRPSLFLTIADLDWATLLANFADAVATRNGEASAMLIHDKLLTKLRELLAVEQIELAAERAAV